MPVTPLQRAKKAIQYDEGLSMPVATQAYTDGYKEQCFLAWYAHNRPRGRQILEIIPADEWERKPHINMIQKWIHEEHWRQRADEMDGEVKSRLREKAIEEKIRMFQRHAEIGSGMVEMGYEFLIENGPENSATAARIIKEGSDMERRSTGAPQAMADVAKMNDRSLQSLIGKLLEEMDSSSPDVTILDGEVKEE